MKNNYFQNSIVEHHFKQILDDKNLSKEHRIKFNGLLGQVKNEMYIQRSSKRIKRTNGSKSFVKSIINLLWSR